MLSNLIWALENNDKKMREKFWGKGDDDVHILKYIFSADDIFVYDSGNDFIICCTHQPIDLSKTRSDLKGDSHLIYLERKNFEFTILSNFCLKKY